VSDMCKSQRCTKLCGQSSPSRSLTENTQTQQVIMPHARAEARTNEITQMHTHMSEMHRQKRGCKKKTKNNKK
jgi:hypothetical protein